MAMLWEVSKQGAYHFYQKWQLGGGVVLSISGGNKTKDIILFKSIGALWETSMHANNFKHKSSQGALLTS
jgi:hypothetical protein